MTSTRTNFNDAQSRNIDKISCSFVILSKLKVVVNMYHRLKDIHQNPMLHHIFLVNHSSNLYIDRPFIYRMVIFFLNVF